MKTHGAVTIIARVTLVDAQVFEVSAVSLETPVTKICYGEEDLKRYLSLLSINGSEADAACRVVAGSPHERISWIAFNDWEALLHVTPMPASVPRRGAYHSS
jgi:hypothetical protein